MMLHQPLWLQNLAAYSLQVALIVAAGSLVPFSLRLRVPKARLIYWQALLAGCLLLPLIQPWKPEVSSTGGWVAKIGFGYAGTAASQPGWSLAEIILAAVLAGIVLRLLWTALGLARLKAYRNRAHTLDSPNANIQEAQTLASCGCDIYISTEISSPVSFGLFSPAVLLPESLLTLPAGQQGAIACHEFLHVSRHDWAWNIAEEFILGILWFHPAVWWAIKNIRLSREQVVDSEVIRRTASRQAYLSALLSMAQRKFERAPAPLFLTERQLVQRVASVVKEAKMSRLRLTTSLLAAAAVLFVAGQATVRAFPLTSPAQAASSDRIGSAISGGGQDSGTGRQTVEAVIFRGNRRISSDALYSRISTRPGQAYSSEVIQRDFNALWKTGYFDDIRIVTSRGETGEIVTFDLQEKRKLLRTPPDAHFSAIFAVPSSAEVSAQPSAEAAHTFTPPSNPPFERGKIYKVGKHVTAPRAIHDTQPAYTEQARKAHLKGTAIFSMVIGTDGRVEEIKEKSKPLGLGLDQSATNAIWNWKFTPGLRNGKPVRVRVVVQVTFRLF